MKEPITSSDHAVGKKISWEAAIWLSQREAASHMRLSPKTARASRERALSALGLDKQAKPYVIEVSGLPPEFSDWEGRHVDLNFDKYAADLGGQAAADELIEAFAMGVAIAIKKGGSWWIMRSAFGKFSRAIEIRKIDDATAQTMLRLPDDWETKVEVWTEENR